MCMWDMLQLHDMRASIRARVYYHQCTHAYIRTFPCTYVYIRIHLYALIIIGALIKTSFYERINNDQCVEVRMFVYVQVNVRMRMCVCMCVICMSASIMMSANRCMRTYVYVQLNVRMSMFVHVNASV